MQLNWLSAYTSGSWVLGSGVEYVEWSLMISVIYCVGQNPELSVAILGSAAMGQPLDPLRGLSAARLQWFSGSVVCSFRSRTTICPWEYAAMILFWWLFWLLFWLGALGALGALGGSGFSGARWERRLQWPELPTCISKLERLDRERRRRSWPALQTWCVLKALVSSAYFRPDGSCHGFHFAPCSMHPQECKEIQESLPFVHEDPLDDFAYKKAGISGINKTEQKFAAAQAVVTSPPNCTGGAVFQHGGPSGRFLRRSLQQGACSWKQQESRYFVSRWWTVPLVTFQDIYIYTYIYNYIYIYIV